MSSRLRRISAASRQRRTQLTTARGPDVSLEITVETTDPAVQGTSAMLHGWGLTAPTRADVSRPTDYDSALALLMSPATSRGRLARGLGRSYGDAAQNAGGQVIDLTGLDRVLKADWASGVVTVEAGLSLDALIRASVAHGWFPAVSPGTRWVTVGGAIAADVHGKNHHRDGSFSKHVLNIVLVTPDGQLHSLQPNSTDPLANELFWATAGGMGLTGSILQAQLQLIPIQSSWMAARHTRAADLDALLDALVEAETAHRYAVAWLDCMATGKHAGRGIVSAGDHASFEHLSQRQQDRALRSPRRAKLAVPSVMPRGVINRASVAAFNEVWFRRAPKSESGTSTDIESLGAFFHPLDGVRNWNHIYGRAGFVQYQFVVGHESALRAALTLIRDNRLPSFLTVLKRFGSSSSGLLSFPTPGWTLATDFPASTPGLAPVLDQLDALVAEAGGRVYLAKDARLRPELLPTMYPALPQFRALRERIDPAQTVNSDLARRLSL